MKNTIKNLFGNKNEQWNFFLFSLVAAVAMILSLRYVDYKMVETSEEAGIAYWGFPFGMLKTGPFYAGFAGSFANKGGMDYIRNAMGADSNPQINWLGLIADFVFYFLMVRVFANIVLKIKTINRHE